MEHLYDKAQQHITEILEHAVLHEGTALVLFDDDADLAKILTEGYRRALPDAEFININELTKDAAMEKFKTYAPGDLVVMVQSGSFRLDDFRIRIFLFQRGLKVIEHMHLHRIRPEQYETYINALHYDKEYYHNTGHALRERLKNAQRAEVRCGDTVLTYETPFEDPKLNIGDYRGMNNVGGTFPIGEVFTEAADLAKVNGEARVYAFAGMDFLVKEYVPPFKVIIKDGILEAGEDAPQAFHDILDLIRKDEPVHVREFGCSINPAIDRQHWLDDVTAFERVTGLHMSLGGKHTIYVKPGLGKKDGRYHIDIFIDAKEILLDGELLYKDGKYLV